MQNGQLAFRQEDIQARRTGTTVVTHIRHGKDRYVWIFHPSGLQIVMPLERLSVVNVNIVIRQGTMSDKIPGIAHALEHLVCKDTLEEGPHPALRALVPIGLRNNAQTNYNTTSYYARSPYRGWKALLNGLVDMVFASTTIDEARWMKERPAILHETRGRSDLARTREAIEAALHQNTPRLQSTMCGSEDEILSLSADDLLDAYERGYHPQNAVIVITGMDDHAKVVHCLERSATLEKCSIRSTARLVERPLDDFGNFNNLTILVPGGKNIERFMMRSSRHPRKRPDGFETWRTAHLLTMLYNNEEGLIRNRLRRERGLLYAGGVTRESFSSSDFYYEFEAGTSAAQMETLGAAWRELWREVCEHISDINTPLKPHVDMMMGTYSLISAERKLKSSWEDPTSMLRSWWFRQRNDTAFQPNMYDLPTKVLPSLLAHAPTLADLEWQEIRILPA
ncbi:insulinase family protein [Patescibacteria group bacterium]|nr:insulinase family protein [Patescibacteria group bacterium]